MAKINVSFILNGRAVEVDVTPEMSLLTVLKEKLNINSVKRACVGGECGACTVIIDGKAMNSCLVLAASMNGNKVETLESLGTPECMHPLQKAFVEMGASQCGFCTPGFIMSAKALLDVNPDPTEEEIRAGLSGNLCRCTGYVKPVQAIMKAVEDMKASDAAVEAIKAAAKRLGN